MKKDTLVIKFSIIFYSFMAAIILINGLNIYFVQKNDYKQQVESKLKYIAAFLSNIVEIEGKRFLYMQDFLLEHISEYRIPANFDGDYRTELEKFDRKFVETYPGKVFDIDISFDDLSYEMKFLYTEFMFRKWLNIFEKAKEKFDIKYAYYLVPSEEYLHMYWLLDFHRGVSKYHGPDFINICADVYEPIDEHKKMWEAWKKGISPQGYDIYDNKYGKTYAYYTPLFIGNRKCGVIGVEIEIDKIKSDILYTSLRQILYMSIIIIICHLLIMYIIYRNSLLKIKYLHKAINLYAVNKNVNIANKIDNNINGNDEISSLAKSFSSLIYEIYNYTNYTKKLLTELYKTRYELGVEHRRAKVLDELYKKDALTGINNKTAYNFAIEKLEKKICEENVMFAIAVIDLNSLKFINDTYGHEKGNFIIKKLCKILCTIFSHSPVYRIGGDEFAIIIENTDLDDIETILIRFVDEMNNMSCDNNLEPWEKVSAAIGIAYYDPSVDKNIESVFKRADDEMYRMKKRMKSVQKD